MIRVKSPAPPIVALLGLLGMVLGEQLGGWILTKKVSVTHAASVCFKFRSKIGMETAIQALRSAYHEKKATMDELWRAAKVCRVVNAMRPYMESLI